MAGHMSNPDHAGLWEDFNPATALELGLDIDFLTNAELLDELDQIEWDSYNPSTTNDDAPKASQQPNDIDDEDREGTSAEQEFYASVVQTESDPLPNLPYDINEKTTATQIASTHEPINISLNTVDPADLLGHAVEDFSDLLGTSDHPGCDLNGSFPDNFELPDNQQGLNFLQDLQVIGSASPGSSEQIQETKLPAVLTNQLRLSKDYQSTKRKQYMPNRAYETLEQAPKTWDIFQYTIDGELDPSRLFSADEINRYLMTHPLNLGHQNPKESQLKLRVHRTPAASAKRFPHGLWCRFKDCPMRTINQGQILVMVDELSVQYPNHDPFLNAAYFHLYCMERYCSFEEICANLNVTAKGRDARWEDGRKNRFCLGGEEEKVVEDWVEACRARDRRKPWVANACSDQPNACPHYDPSSLAYKGTLCHQLTVTKLHRGGQGRITLRKDREDRAGYEGANITRHLGDLSKEAELREFSRCHRNQNQLKPNPKTGRHYRADGDAIREEEQSDDSHSESDLQQTHQMQYQVHGTKRNRDEHDDAQTLGHDIVPAHKKPMLEMPTWRDNEEIYPAGTPGTPPRATLTPKSGGRHSQLQMTAASLSQDGRSASISGHGLTAWEDESEGEMELEILAAQRRRRLLEIEDAKDREKECRLKKLKLQEGKQKKRAREGGEDDVYVTDSKEKRQRV